MDSGNHAFFFVFKIISCTFVLDLACLFTIRFSLLILEMSTAKCSS